MQKIPPITRNLLIINVVCYLAQFVFRRMGIDLTQWLGLHFVLADRFNVFQFVSYMFLHGSLTHLFFNMFSLWMFGGLIEQTLGPKRFLIYYFICGIGAGICQEFWQTGEYFIGGLANYDMVKAGTTFITMGDYLNLWTTIGASGACYGILLAFGMLYPNERIMLLIPPIPMKAKYFVAGYAAIEVIAAWSSNDNVAHFAHLGGMLFGWFLLVHWRRQQQRRQSPYGAWDRWEDSRRQNASLSSRLKHWWESVRLGSRGTRPGNARHAPQGPTATRTSDYDFNMKKKEDERRMDEILDKVRASGYDSLTADEKRELFRISRK